MKITKTSLIFIIICELLIVALIYAFINRDSLFISSSIQKSGTSPKPQIFYVNTYAGLVFRMNPGSTQEKIGVIPFGAPVELIEKSNIQEKISGHDGIWLKIRWDTRFFSDRNQEYKEGWCFSGFLTENDPGFAVPVGATAGTPLQLDKAYQWSMDKENMIGGGQSTSTIVFSANKTVEQHDNTELDGAPGSLDYRFGRYKVKNGIVYATFTRSTNNNDKLEKTVSEDISDDSEFLCAENADYYFLMKGRELVYFISK